MMHSIRVRRCKRNCKKCGSPVGTMTEEVWRSTDQLCDECRPVEHGKYRQKKG